MKITLFRTRVYITDLVDSKLYDESTFYQTFIRDLKSCKSEVIIESPFVTKRRLTRLLPTLQKLKDQKVRVVINTRDPLTNNDEYQRADTQEALSALQHAGVHVLYTGAHHRKLAILDRKVLYEGSLNVLSQNDSCEVMRRIESVQLAWQMIKFIGLDKRF